MTTTYVSCYAYEGNKSVAYELYEQMEVVPEWVVVQVGSGPLLYGVWKGFRELRTDFLRHRYESHAVVVLASIGIVASLMVYMSAQFVGGARILQEITGVPYVWLVIIFAGMVAF